MMCSGALAALLLKHAETCLEVFCAKCFVIVLLLLLQALADAAREAGLQF
jgi:hypothetical protein